jgi:hypothetical protein
MANPRPTGLAPTWATNDDYDPGTDPWSGQPLKVEPSSGDKAAGFIPNTRPPPEWVNWFFNKIGGFAAYLADVAYLNWPVAQWTARKTPYGVADLDLWDGSYLQVKGTAKCFWYQALGVWIGLGHPTANLYYFGYNFFAQPAGTPGTGLRYSHGVPTADGRIILADHIDQGTGNVFVDRSGIKDLTSWTSVTLHTGASTFGAVGASCVKADGTIVMVGGIDNALKSWTSTDHGATFTEHTVVATTGGQALAGVREGKNGRLFTWVFDSFANGGGGIYYSDDNGATWTPSTLLSFDYIRDVIYLANHDMYVVIQGVDGTNGSYGVTADPTTDGAYTWTTLPIQAHIVAADTDGTSLVFTVKDESSSPTIYYTEVTADLFNSAAKIAFLHGQSTDVCIAPFYAGYQACLNGTAAIHLSLKAG